MNGLALFAGISGLEQGINIAFPETRTICYVEGEAYAASVLTTRMEQGDIHPAPIWSNVTTFDGTPWAGKVDFISAGFPCQPASKAGKLGFQNDPRWLWPQIERIVCEIRPNFLFLENVSNLLNGGFSPVLGSLATLGFNVEWGCLRVSEIGGPHQRDRIFILAYRPEARSQLAHTMCQRFHSRWSNSIHRSTIDRQGRLERGIAESSNPNVPNSNNNRQYDESLNEEQITCSSEPQFPNLDPCWWQTEPRVGRVAHGTPNRVDRIRANGNGVVPLQAAVAYTILSGRCLNEN